MKQFQELLLRASVALMPTVSAIRWVEVERILNELVGELDRNSDNCEWLIGLSILCQLLNICNHLPDSVARLGDHLVLVLVQFLDRAHTHTASTPIAFNLEQRLRLAVAFSWYMTITAEVNAPQALSTTLAIERIFAVYDLRMPAKADITNVMGLWEVQLRSYRMALMVAGPELAPNTHLVPQICRFLNYAFSLFAQGTSDTIDWYKWEDIASLIQLPDSWIFHMCLLERLKQVSPPSLGLLWVCWVVEEMLQSADLHAPTVLFVCLVGFNQAMMSMMEQGLAGVYMMFATKLCMVAPVEFYGAFKVKGEAGLHSFPSPYKGKGTSLALSDEVYNDTLVYSPTPSLTTYPIDTLVSYCDATIQSEEVVQLIKQLPKTLFNQSREHLMFCSTLPLSTNYLNLLIHFFLLDSVTNPKIIVWTVSLLHHFDLWSNADFRVVLEYLTDSWKFYQNLEELDRRIIPNDQFAKDISFEIVPMNLLEVTTDTIRSNLELFKLFLFVVYFGTKEIYLRLNK